jgi:hypothetical protein
MTARRMERGGGEREKHGRISTQLVVDKMGVCGILFRRKKMSIKPDRHFPSMSTSKRRAVDDVSEQGEASSLSGALARHMQPDHVLMIHVHRSPVHVQVNLMAQVHRTPHQKPIRINDRNMRSYLITSRTLVKKS